MRFLSLSLATLLLGVPARAADKDAAYETESGHLVCTTPASLREAQEAINKRDKAWLDSIKECSQSKAGLKAEIIQGGMLTAKIKVYDANGRSTIYWTSPTTVKEVRR